MDDLTEEEIAMIKDSRKKKERDAAILSLSLEILRVAHEFNVWLVENGAGATFSTFCDDYGYQGENRSEVYTFAVNARTAARGAAADIVDSAW